MTRPSPTRLIGVALNAAIDKTAEVDRLVEGAIHRPEALVTLPGGKAANVARAALTLGLPSSVVAIVGGHAGRWWVESLGSRGVHPVPAFVEGETRTCLSILDRSTGSLTEFYEAGVEVSQASWAEVEAKLVHRLVDDPDGAVVVIAGSLPPGVPTDACARLATIASDAGARAVVDIGGPPLRTALAAKPWLVKVNADEAATVTGFAIEDVRSALTAARHMLEIGAMNVLITRGTSGAVLATHQAAWTAGDVPERGQYTVGSGDALLAGFLAELSNGGDSPSAFRRGLAAAVANALVPGQGELRTCDVDRLARLVRVDEAR